MRAVSESLSSDTSSTSRADSERDAVQGGSANTVDSVLEYLDRQDADRGDWPRQRDADAPAPPWPSPHNPTLRYLLHRAKERLGQGEDVDAVLVSLAVHAWFEGGVEAYDRGQREARQRPGG